MGVRGKVEAVIYAAEEPVTLQQLVALFGDELLAEREMAQVTVEAVPSDAGAAGTPEAGSLELREEGTEDNEAPDNEAPEAGAEESSAADEAPAHDAVPGEPLVEQHEGNENVTVDGEQSEEAPHAVEGVEDPGVSVGHANGEAPQDQEDQKRPESATKGSGDADSAGDTPQVPPTEPYEAHGEPLLFGDPDADKRAARLRDREAREAMRAVLDELMAEYDANDRGMEIREIAGGYRVATKPEYHDAVRSFAKSLKPVMKLSLQALETLAVIAYKQPVTAPEVSEIRGVDSGGVLGSLISRKLVTTAGRKQVVGRPILYKTTKEFLLRFGLKDLAELPSMEEFEKMAGELQSIGDEGEAAQEQPEAPMLPLEAGAAEEKDASDASDGEPVEALPGERPSLAPSEIVDSEEEAVPVGISVDLSGRARNDDTPEEKHEGHERGGE